MTVLYIVLAVLAVLVIAVMCIRLTVDICIGKAEGEDLKEEYILTVLGCRIDLLEIAEDNKDKPDKSGNKSKPELTLTERLHNIFDHIRARKSRHALLEKYIRKRIKIHNFDFDMTFGLDDAADTGIATGAAWSVVYNIFGFVAHHFTVKNHKITVNPVFDRECFSLLFRGKIRVTVLDILALQIFCDGKLLKI